MPKIKLKILSQEFSQKIGLEFIQKFDIYWVGTIGAITICAIVIYAIEIFSNPNKIPILMQIMRSAQVLDKHQFGAIALFSIAQISIAQISIAQISIAQISIAQISIAQISIAQMAIAP